MYLTREEEKILAGEYGYAYSKAMEILVAIGKIYKASKLIEISSAHISGVSYKNIGEEGLKFLSSLAIEGRVRVPTTLNPAGFDTHKWKEMGINKEFVEKQMEVINIFRRMGIRPTLTCTPYYKENLPSKGEHVAWAESSAVTLINSLIGAYTNRESGISALAAALIGKTPLYGLHTPEGRQPTYTIQVKAKLRKLSEYGVLGYLIAKEMGNKIPLIKGIDNANMDMLKYLSASLATYGGTPMFHAEGLTPGYDTYEEPRDKLTIDGEDLKRGFEELRDDLDNVDMVWIGCPHASLEELKYISEVLDGKRVKRRLVITTSRVLLDEAREMGLLDNIYNAGGEIYADTCIIVSPIGEALSGVLTSSTKAYYYLKGVHKLNVYVADLDECLNYALGGN